MPAVKPLYGNQGYELLGVPIFLVKHCVRFLAAGMVI